MNPKEFRFNYRRCKMHHDPRDCFSERGKQMRDVWDILRGPATAIRRRSLSNCIRAC